MIIVYTGASKQGAVQKNPDISLGGFPSGSQIPNDYLSNIFSAASYNAIQSKRRETKLIAIKNDSVSAVTGLTFDFTLEEDSICNYKVAFSNPTVTADCSCFEQIDNAAALPYYATFQNIVDGSSFSLPDLDAGAYLGIWLTREFNYSSDDLKKKSCADWLEVLEDQDSDESVNVPSEKETLTMAISYT